MSFKLWAAGALAMFCCMACTTSESDSEEGGAGEGGQGAEGGNSPEGGGAAAAATRLFVVNVNQGVTASARPRKTAHRAAHHADSGRDGHVGRATSSGRERRPVCRGGLTALSSVAKALTVTGGAAVAQAEGAAAGSTVPTARARFREGDTYTP